MVQYNFTVRAFRSQILLLWAKEWTNGLLRNIFSPVVFQDRQLKIKELVLSAHERAVRNCPWTMGLWKSYLLALERHRTDHQTVTGTNIYNIIINTDLDSWICSVLVPFYNLWRELKRLVYRCFRKGLECRIHTGNWLCRNLAIISGLPEETCWFQQRQEFFLLKLQWLSFLPCLCVLVKCLVPYSSSMVHNNRSVNQMNHH